MYPVTIEPFVTDGAAQRTLACPPPAASARASDGGPGGPSATTGLDGADGALLPNELVATTDSRYVVPGTKPATVAEVCDGLFRVTLAGDPGPLVGLAVTV